MGVVIAFALQARVPLEAQDRYGRITRMQYDRIQYIQYIYGFINREYNMKKKATSRMFRRGGRSPGRRSPCGPPFRH
jgi:hypothetical protein